MFAVLQVELYAEKVATRGLCAIAQAESLRYKLIGGLAVRRYVMFMIIHALALCLTVCWYKLTDFFMSLNCTLAI